MQVFFYDGTFAGLLSIVFEAYSSKVFPEILLKTGKVAPLTTTGKRDVPTDLEKAGRVWRALQKKLSRRAFTDLHYASMADNSKSATLLFRHIRKIIDAKRTREVENHLTDPETLAVFDLARKVSYEKHKLLGFVRFQKTTQGIYFAAIEPEYDLLPLLSGHFRGRFGPEQWILYDARRRYGIYHDGTELREMYMDPALLHHGSLAPGLLADEEKIFRQLWKSYFSAASIAERENPDLQVRCMPRRFWKYLPEKS